MLKRTCAKCGKAIGYTEVCKCSTQYNRNYDKYSRHNKDIYNSKKWIKTREAVLNRDEGKCMTCYKTFHKIVQATTVHHIIEISEDKSKAYDIDNLVSVCDICHRPIIHTAYNSSGEDRKKMQEYLKDIIDNNSI